jgi:hypothetical protein
VTVHDVSYLGNPDAGLARAYSRTLESNLFHALDAKRLDHAVIWSTLRGLLTDPPPPYSQHPIPQREADPRRERDQWEKGIARKRALVDQMWVDSLELRLTTIASPHSSPPVISRCSL